MLNRAALILRYKHPFVDWINAADPSPSSHTLTLAEVNQEHTVYLVEVEDEDELSRWLARHHEELFDEELKGWYTDPALWRGTGRSRCSRSGVRWSSTPWWWTPVSLRSKTMSSKNEPCRATRNPADQSFRSPQGRRDRFARAAPGRARPRPAGLDRGGGRAGDRQDAASQRARRSRRGPRSHRALWVGLGARARPTVLRLRRCA